MKKKVYALVFTCLIGGVFMDNANATMTPIEYKNALEEGIDIGMNVERMILAKELINYKKLLLSILDYQKFMYQGKVPLSVLKEDVKQIKNPDGSITITKNLKFNVPNFIVPSEVYNLTNTMEGVQRTIPSGYWVYIDTREMPLKKIYFLWYLMKKDGYTPIILDKENKILVSIYDREIDARYSASKIKEKYDIKVDFDKFDSYKYVDDNITNIDDNKIIKEINSLSDEIIKKQKELLQAMKESDPNVIVANINSLDTLINALETTRQKVEYMQMPNFRKDLFIKDLSTIILKLRKYKDALDNQYLNTSNLNGNSNAITLQNVPNVIEIEKNKDIVSGQLQSQQETKPQTDTSLQKPKKENDITQVKKENKDEQIQGNDYYIKIGTYNDINSKAMLNKIRKLNKLGIESDVMEYNKKYILVIKGFSSYQEAKEFMYKKLLPNGYLGLIFSDKRKEENK